MKGKSMEIYDEYVIKFRAWEEYVARLAANTGDVDLSDSSMSSRSVQQHYDPPQTSSAGAEATSYLDTQDVNSFEQSSQSGLEPETVRQYMDAVRDPFEEWAARFDKLFYWGM